MTLLVTGANGFVGKAVCRAAQSRGLQVRAAVRRLASTEAAATIPHFAVGEVHGATDWHKALQGCDCVIHLAALAHKPLGSDANAQAGLHATNVEGALRLASQAADAGVRRLVFLSSIKAWGEASQPGHPAREDDACRPEDTYGRSKLVAEQALRALASEQGLELVIVRSPLVYGPGVKANFAALVRAVGAGWPLPLGAVSNARSLVALDNLVDFLLCCATHPRAAGEVFNVSDGADLSTADLARILATTAGRPARLFPVPASWLQFAGRLLGRAETVRRLVDNLQVDITKAQQMLGWHPPLTVEQGMRRLLAGGSLQ